MNTTALDPNRWKALAVLGAAFFMTVLDVAIANVALPTIGEDLEFSQENLQWVVTAYALTYGGFLLLGGRAADLLGRRSVFMTGVTLFTAASLVCGLASSEWMLITARAVQGVGAAITAPAGLSIVMSLFPEGAERNRALGIWGMLAGSGAGVGVLAGGFLVRYAGWEWVFFVNVPVGLVVIALTLAIVRESRIVTGRRRFDPFGAVVITGALIVLVYGLTKGPDVGWGSAQTILLLLAAVALLGLFLLIETRIEQPLMPLDIFRIRTVAAANSVGFLLGGCGYSLFFLLTLYVQQVLGYSALETGFAFLVTAGVSIPSAVLAEMLVQRIGTKVVLVIGLALIAAGFLWWTQVDVDGSFLVDLLPGMIVAGAGVVFAYIPNQITALSGVEERRAGLASGLIETNQTIGGAVGLAIVATAATTRTTHLLDNGEPLPNALTEGFQLGFLVAALLAVLAGIVAIVMLRRIEVVPTPEALPGAASPCFGPNRAATATISMGLLTGGEPERPGEVPG